jgi:insulysin
VPLQKEDIYECTITSLPANKTSIFRRLQKETSSEESALKVYYQIDEKHWYDSVHKLRDILALLQTWLTGLFYKDLRTEQQLGYDVSVTMEDHLGNLGLSFNVKGDAQEPNYVADKVSQFLKSARISLEEMGEEEFRKVVGSTIYDNCTEPLRLKRDSKDMWDEVSSHCYDFEETTRLRAGLTGLAKAEVCDLWEKIFVGDAKRLEVQIICDDHWKKSKKMLDKRPHRKLYSIEKWHAAAEEFYIDKYSIRNKCL